MKVFAKSTVFGNSNVGQEAFERNILEEAKILRSPFITSLAFAFQKPSHIYLFQHYPIGSDMVRLLRREGRFTISWVQFYLAEIILGLQFLRQSGIRYYGLKPERVLLDAHGHAVLSYFGFPQATFLSGDPMVSEYTAPEMLLDDRSDLGMADFWSLGAIAFEMACGRGPLHAKDTVTSYTNTKSQGIRAPKDVLNPHGKNLIKGLLNRSPKHRLGALHEYGELIDHPFFENVDWEQTKRRAVAPPFKPTTAPVTADWAKRMGGEGSTKSASLYETAQRRRAPHDVFGEWTSFLHPPGFTFVEEGLHYPIGINSKLPLWTLPLWTVSNWDEEEDGGGEEIQEKSEEGRKRKKEKEEEEEEEEEELKSRRVSGSSAKPTQGRH